MQACLLYKTWFLIYTYRKRMVYRVKESSVLRTIMLAVQLPNVQRPEERKGPKIQSSPQSPAGARCGETNHASMEPFPKAKDAPISQLYGVSSIRTDEQNLRPYGAFSQAKTFRLDPNLAPQGRRDPAYTANGESFFLGPKSLPANVNGGHR